MMSRWHVWVALALCASGVFGVAVLTNEMPPEHDALVYLRMAESGVLSEPRVAPFAYRPLVPWLAGVVAGFAEVSVAQSFYALAFSSAVLLVWLAYLFLRSFGVSSARAACGAGIVLLTFSHVKWAMFFSSLIDIEAAVVVLLGMWAAFKRRYGACFALSMSGFLVKDPAVLPAAVLCFELAQRWWTSKRGTDFSRLSIAVGAFGAAILLPRLLIDVAVNHQPIDPINRPSSLGLLLDLPLNWRRDVNLLISWLIYWLPTLMLMSRVRSRFVWRELGDEGLRGVLAVYLVVLVVLNLYGGTNLFTFVSYSLAAQLIVLRYLLMKAAWPELGLVLVAVLWLNKTLLRIPLPGDDAEAFYRSLVGGWHTYLSDATWWQFAQVGVAIGMAWGVRRATSQRGGTM